MSICPNAARLSLVYSSVCTPVLAPTVFADVLEQHAFLFVSFMLVVAFAMLQPSHNLGDSLRWHRVCTFSPLPLGCMQFLLCHTCSAMLHSKPPRTIANPHCLSSTLLGSVICMRLLAFSVCTCSTFLRTPKSPTHSYVNHTATWLPVSQCCVAWRYA